MKAATCCISCYTLLYHPSWQRNKSGRLRAQTSWILLVFNLSACLANQYTCLSKHHTDSQRQPVTFTPHLRFKKCIPNKTLGAGHAVGACASWNWQILGSPTQWYKDSIKTNVLAPCLDIFQAICLLCTTRLFFILTVQAMAGFHWMTNAHINCRVG